MRMLFLLIYVDSVKYNILFPGMHYLNPAMFAHMNNTIFLQ